MIPLFTKPLGTITADDVDHLIQEQLPEGQQVEFKRTLPSEEETGDPWLKGGKHIGKYARKEILAEVVAFANADGGNIVIGIEETDNQPHRAKKVNATPRCHDLADCLRKQARDCIDPQLPSIEIQGIETQNGKGAGVVIIRIPPSRMGPHQLDIKGARECYMRHADRTEPMTMREIQDRTIFLARGLELIEQRLEERRKHFLQIFPPHITDRRTLVGCRVTVLPIGGRVYVDRPYSISEFMNLSCNISAKFGSDIVELYFPRGDHLAVSPFRPMLRGCHRSYEEDNRVILQEIHCDGLSELVFRSSPREGRASFHLGWILSQVANALLVADRVRKHCHAPGVELALELEIRHDDLDSGSDSEPVYIATLFGHSPYGENHSEVQPIPLQLQMSVGTYDEFPGTVKDVLNDLLNASGAAAIDAFDIELPSESDIQ